jgi:hypothetical protein
MERNSVTIGDKLIERLPIPDTTRLFSTPDIYEAAFLLGRGRRIVRVQYRDRYRFYFERTPEFESDLSSFHANAQMGIRDLVSAIYSVKRMMREEEAGRR